LEALLRALLETVEDQALERGIDVPIRAGEIAWLLAQDRRHRLGRRVAVEGALA
jgi:hypothetical protein